MKSEFDRLSLAVDAAVNGLPNFSDYKNSNDLFFTNHSPAFTFALKNMLVYLQADDIKDYYWHEHVSCLSFKPVKSPYFRLGLFGIINKVPVASELECIIGVGFDEDLDYANNELPQIVLFYINNDYTSDINLYKTNQWIKSVKESFNIS